MIARWLRKEGGDRLILFWNGWGMDERAIGHMNHRADVLAFWDYAEAPGERPEWLSCLGSYRRIDAVAWSLGVWAASEALPRWGVLPEIALAVNGTLRPIDRRRGIHPAVFDKTLEEWNPENRDRFCSLMAGDAATLSDASAFSARGTEDQRRELASLRSRILAGQDTEAQAVFTHALASGGDRIFSPLAQRAHWAERGVEIAEIDGPHWCFARFRDLEGVLSHATR